MKDNPNKNSLKKLFDRLQEDSWQLELLVSGFTIFGLFYLIEPVQEAYAKAVFLDDVRMDVYLTTLFAIQILLLNLVMHVIFRSVWIGALGLRYISGEVEIENLKYSQHFTKYLTKKIGSFDTYIERLEKICSIIFAISFLLIFYVAAVYIVVHLISFLGNFTTSAFINVGITILIVFLMVGAVLTFIDYLTQGLLKKNKWVAKVYFPFYWVFSYLTLSFLYRPLYYNLIDNRFGRRVSIMLVPIYISILVLSSLYKTSSEIINIKHSTSNNVIANRTNYEDSMESYFEISTLAIQSKVITEPYLEVKIPFNDAIERRILKRNEGLNEFRQKKRYKRTFKIGLGKDKLSVNAYNDSLQQAYVNTFQQIYTIMIDSVHYKTDFVITNSENLFTFETFLGIGNISEGKHLLTYARYKHANTDSLIVLKEIPFWYYKD